MLSLLHRHARPLAAAVALATAASVAAPAPALAWDPTGHAAIALIAWRHMTPEARTIAIRLLEAAPADAGLASLRPDVGTAADRDRALFALAATWPDVVRASSPAARHAYHHGNWHYVDQYWQTVDGKPQLVTSIPADSQDVGERITAFTKDLETQSGTRAQRGVELAWLMHLVGDIAQPLHNSSHVTPDRPKGDAGGNAIKLGPQTHNLHALWDDALGLAIPIQPGEDSVAYAARIADSVEHDRPLIKLAGQVEPGRVDLWEREGLALTEQVAYTPAVTPGQDPDAAYMTTAFQTDETQAALAGYRLAELLNRILPKQGS